MPSEAEVLAVPDPVIPNTFNSIPLDAQASADLAFPNFIKEILAKLEHLKNERFAFYEGLRRSNTLWANGARRILSVLGAVAFLATGAAAAVRFMWPEWPGDKLLLIAVLAIYAVMGAISFYEKGSGRTSSYFRQVGVILAIRDLWTKFQFEVLKELTAKKSAADPAAAEAAARERIRVLAEGFVGDLDKAANAEVTSWQTEFTAALSQLEAAAQKGTGDVTARIQDSIKAAEQAAAAAKADAEKAAVAAAEAAKSAREAGRPGGINLTVTGDFDDQVVISVDGKELARSTGKTIALQPVPPGQRAISAHAKKGARDLDASVLLDVKPGLQELRIALS